MKYEVLTTAQAAADLRAIFAYIAYDLLAGQNALNQLDRLEQAILSLDEMPERYHLYDKEPWKERNLRIMPVDNYLVFYAPPVYASFSTYALISFASFLFLHFTFLIKYEKTPHQRLLFWSTKHVLFIKIFGFC